MVLVGGKSTDVMQVNSDEPCIQGPPEDAFVERALEHGWKKGENVKLHARILTYAGAGGYSGAWEWSIMDALYWGFNARNAEYL